MTAGQREPRDEVDGQAARSDREHRHRVDRRRLRHRAMAVSDDPDGSHTERDTVGERGERLGSPKTVRSLQGARSRGHSLRHDRQTERPGVGEHVARIGHEREAVHQPARHRLDDHEPDGERQRHKEPTLGRHRRVVVVIIVVMIAWW